MKERKKTSDPQPSEESPSSHGSKQSRKSAKGDVPRRPTKAKRGGASCWTAVTASTLVGLVILFAYQFGTTFFSSPPPMPRAITPLPVARVTDLEQFQGEHRERLFWGTYRPHLYFGIRSRTPKSLLAGLMWIGPKDGQYALRHTCEEGDHLKRYSWLRHDGATYGRQELLDEGLLLSTSFLKTKGPGSGYGGDWAVRIRVDDDKPQLETGEEVHQRRVRTVFFYVAEEAGRPLTFWPEGANNRDAPFVAGFANEIGEWQLYSRYEEGVTMNYVGLRHLQMNSLAKPLWTILETQVRTKGVVQLPDTSEKYSNVAVIQLTGTAPFEMDIVFISGVQVKGSQTQSRVEKLLGASLGETLAKKEQEFEDRFHETFKMHDRVQRAEEVEVAKVSLSNMVGGIGYFYGQSRIAIPNDLKDPQVDGPNYWNYWPAELYSAVPSRSFFPRGFLWDEGFHQLVISRWDQNISRDIIGHWLDLMNIDGWIPREQILGAEAQSKVPDEFINQYTDNANPPTLFLVLNRNEWPCPLLKRFQSDHIEGITKEGDLLFIKAIYPRLEAWFDWFNTTQNGKEPWTYYWHGRDGNTDKELNPKMKYDPLLDLAQTLSSGFDDYPRASHPSDDERHVDLWCWMALAARTMTLIARIAGEPYEKYDATAKMLTNFTRLNQMHYDYESGRYYDYGNHSQKVMLKWYEVRDEKSGFLQRILRRAVLKQPKLGLVQQFGYVSFFPFAMGIIPHDSPVLGHHLEMLHSHQLLWTDYGLRSLAATSSLYMKRNTEHDAPYWRGPIWINMNYLILSAVHRYATVEGPYQKTAAIIYSQLRQNLIRNIVDKYYDSGYLWENYNGAAKGKGQGSHPFTGWTSLVLLVMGEIF